SSETVTDAPRRSPHSGGTKSNESCPMHQAPRPYPLPSVHSSAGEDLRFIPQVPGPQQPPWNVPGHYKRPSWDSFSSSSAPPPMTFPPEVLGSTSAAWRASLPPFRLTRKHVRYDRKRQKQTIFAVYTCRATGVPFRPIINAFVRA